MAIELDDLELLRLYLDDSTDSEGNTFFRDDHLAKLIADNVDLYAAAAMGWRIKAARVVEWFNVDLGDAQMSMGQAFRHAIDMAREFQNQSAGEIFSVKLDTEFLRDTSESEMA